MNGIAIVALVISSIGFLLSLLNMVLLIKYFNVRRIIGILFLILTISNIFSSLTMLLYVVLGSASVSNTELVYTISMLFEYLLIVTTFVLRIHIFTLFLCSVLNANAPRHSRQVLVSLVLIVVVTGGISTGSYFAHLDGGQFIALQCVEPVTCAAIASAVPLLWVLLEIVFMVMLCARGMWVCEWRRVFSDLKWLVVSILSVAVLAQTELVNGFEENVDLLCNSLNALLTSLVAFAVSTFDSPAPTSFDELMKLTSGRDYFRAFLTTVHSDELFDFLAATAQLRLAAAAPEKQRALIVEIYKHFCCPEAERYVYMDPPIPATLAKQLQMLGDGSFDAAAFSGFFERMEVECTKSLRCDMFPAFLSSALFSALEAELREDTMMRSHSILGQLINSLGCSRRRKQRLLSERGGAAAYAHPFLSAAGQPSALLLSTATELA
eukprot:gnl/Chilomastix_cuspidata/2597.p1 GENE.gnl/Chilomastix_cuspidata/2597~~gnl/Chilomastix_cuspidata/2597.p1  ORF type:complete len:438 (-),score=196.65 gnl/Chilomastix_cuspidata/2597:28-1341(-)